MTSPELSKEQYSIVLVGAFNPLIFHPEWFVRHEILSPVDIEDVEVEIVHQDIAKFNLQWLTFEVLKNRLIVITNDPSQADPLRDLVISTFALLEHTPLQQLGMNLTLDYSTHDEELWHKIGDTLAPKAIWEKSLEKRVGLLSLRVASPRNDDLEGKINVTIEPSKQVEYGVNVNINNHVELSEDSDLANILSTYWTPAIDHAKYVGNTTVNEAIK